MKIQTIVIFTICCNATALAEESNPTLWRNGIYAGINAGYGVGTNSSSSTLPTPLVDNLSTSFNNIPSGIVMQTPILFGASSLANNGSILPAINGVIGGGQIGYNYIISNKYIIGAEADFQGSGMRGSGDSFGLVNQYGLATQPASVDISRIVVSNSIVGKNDISASIDWIGTLRGRAGYLASENIMFFISGGIAYAGASAFASQYQISDNYVGNLPNGPVYRAIFPKITGTGSYGGDRFGFSVGGGGEWMANRNWSIKSEAVYYNLGSTRILSTPNLSSTENGYVSNINLYNTYVNYQGILARIGLNYHFDQ